MATREDLRLVNLLSGGPGRVAERSSGDLAVVVDGCGSVAVSRAVLADLARRRLVARDGGNLRLTPEGKAFAKRAGSDDPFLDQHRAIETRRVEVAGRIEAVRVNLNESPLASLMRRKTAGGEAYLSEREFRAGERLRGDFTRAQMMPRLGIAWEPHVGSSGGGPGDFTDASLAARQRVNRAVAAVGPELSGVLLDVCCFLKGVEAVEAERRWPARSAKLMLKTGLAMLSRHYERGHSRK